MKLRLDHITLPLAEFTLEADLELSAPVTGIRGPSGAGKTSLLEVIAGLRRPATGSVQLNERVLVDTATRIHLPPEQRRVGYVPQDLALFPHLSTRANLFYGLRTLDENPDTPYQKNFPDHVIDLLELRPLLHRRIPNLSGGEKQRVALGRALLASPQILLLDEPLSSLDDRLKEQIIPYLQEIRREFQVPIIYVTHSQKELEAMCDEVLVMERGEIKRDTP